jgi:hypothetical protein
MAYIISHLADYNSERNDFVKGDWVATLGNTGESFGIHGHLQDVPGATTITDFYRTICTGKVIRPAIESIIDMNNHEITLDYYVTDEKPYTPSKPHFGIDFIVKNDPEQKLVINVPIQIIEKSFDKSFGNYIIFEVLWDQVGNQAPAPKPQNKKMTEYFYNGWRNDEVIPFYASDLIDLGNGEYRLGQNSQGWLKDTRFR